jgi:hypothetical protein
MSPTAAAILLAITETAKLLQTPAGQELLSDIVKGGEGAGKAIEGLISKVQALFHHTSAPAETPAKS